MRARVDGFIDAPPAPIGEAALIVGFSGGLDSTVLLHALATAGYSNLRAAHVHHGLQANADEWAAQCIRYCASLQVPIDVLRVRIEPDDARGPEAAAREARYGALRGLMRPGDWLITAHHRSDQAETVLLRLLRGTGVQGLGAMREWSEFDPGRLWRPLLSTARAEIQAYAKVQSLSWIEDPQNADPRYTRSWLRTSVMPQLSERFPEADESLSRASKLCAEASDLLDDLAGLDFGQTSDGDELKIAELLELSTARRHNLLRYWLHRRGFRSPAAALFEQVDRELLSATHDAQPVIGWSGCELRRYRNRLYAMPRLPPAPGAEFRLHWDSGLKLELPAGCGWLESKTPPPMPLVVRFIHPGETFKPAGSAHTRSLKNLFQEAGVPPWLRARTPIIEIDTSKVWAGGIGIGADWPPLMGTHAWSPAWLR